MIFGIRASPLTTTASDNLFSGAASFSLRNRAMRALWIVVWMLFASWTPPPMHRWRGVLLRLFGAKVHPTARIYGSVKVWYPPHLDVGEQAVLGPQVRCYNQGQITIGKRAIVSQGASLCTGTHDVRDPAFQLVTRPIVIGAQAWICAEAFVGPGVTVGEGAVLAARGTTFKDLTAWDVHLGNPAVRIKSRAFGNPARKVARLEEMQIRP